MVQPARQVIPDELSERELAIGEMREARDIHLAWVAFYQGSPHQSTEMVPQAEATGDVAWHQCWVEKYDRVLRLLEADNG